MIAPRLKSPSGADHDNNRRISLNNEKNEALASTLSDIRLKQKESRVERAAKQNGQLYINLQQFPLVQDALILLDRLFCEKEQVVCFYVDDEQIRIAAVNPGNPALTAPITDLEARYRVHAVLYAMSEDSLRAALKRYDAIPKIIRSNDEGIELSEASLKKEQEKVTSIKKMNELIARAPVTEVLSLVVGSAIKSNASDIHIEAEADDIKIRMRIDGILHDVGELPKDAWQKVVARVKLMAKLKLNIIDAPQDGRFTIFIDQDKIEVRVSTVPTSYGESIAMRLLRFSALTLDFENLGLTGYSLAVLEREIKRPNGMIISTGPTGSGKTTTLYAILQKLNSPESKILTLEDPIEYKVKGINQTQVNLAAEMTFAKGLRSLLRQDPDIIMVGEVRDLETAETAINAALIGQLVLSTLHTNSAAGSIPRLLAMGTKPFLVAPAINALIGQRLVRRLCQHCKKQEDTPADVRKRVIEALEPLKGRTDIGIADITQLATAPFYTATGCVECGDLGYRGRIGIFELLTMDKELEKIILAGNVSETDIEENAQKHGMITMFQDGILKAIQGITSLSEVFRETE